MKGFRLLRGRLVANVHRTPLVLAALLGIATPSAFAHAVILFSEPAAEATVRKGPLAVRLRFNSRIDASRSRVALHAPYGPDVAIAIASDASEAALIGRADVSSAGVWTIRWQVLSLDGHVTRGEIPFVVEDGQQSS